MLILHNYADRPRTVQEAHRARLVDLDIGLLRITGHAS
jgi:hypothetical protein